MPDSPIPHATDHPAETTVPHATDHPSNTAVRPAGIDPRGPRFGAAVTSVLLVGVLLLGAGPTAAALLTVIALLFALGVSRGVQGTLQGLAFKAWIRPRLTPPADLEDPRPPRFAQLIGLLVVGLGLLVAALGVPAAVPIAAAVASDPIVAAR